MPYSSNAGIIAFFKFRAATNSLTGAGDEGDFSVDAHVYVLDLV